MTGLGGLSWLTEIDGREWSTPLTSVRDGEVGSARLKTGKYKRAPYPLEGVRGLEAYEVVGGALPVKYLQRRSHGGRGVGTTWKTWMVDDPKHWWGMREAVDKLPPGRVIVAGLGLGLMLHHMAELPRLTLIDVVEIDPDVVDLILPTLPPDPRVTIKVADFYQYVYAMPPGSYDSVLWDLAVGDPHETRRDFMLATAHSGAAQPDAELVCFGHAPKPASDHHAKVRRSLREGTM